jgi:hypothetical protein
MINEKYGFKEFVQVYISLVKASSTNSETEEYYAILYEALSDFFELDISVQHFEDSMDTVLEGRNFKNEGIQLLNSLIEEYNDVRDVFATINLATSGMPEDLFGRFEKPYYSSLSKRRETLFNMIVWLCKEIFGSRKRTITHEFIRKNTMLAVYEMQLNTILNKIYLNDTVRNRDNWSGICQTADLAVLGYTSVLPEYGQTIPIGNFLITTNPLGKNGYMIKPINA